MSSFVSLMFKLFSFLPMPVMQMLGRCIASLIMLFSNASPNKNIRRNIQLVFPTLNSIEQTSLIKQSLSHQAMSLLEFVKIWGSDDAYALSQIHRVNGEALFHDALDNPNGCIAIVPHLGSWEVMNAWINQFSSPVMMYKPFRNKSIDRFVRQARSRSNAQLVPTDETGVRQIFKTLKQGGFTIVLPDHIPQLSGGVDTDFFGYPVLSTTLVSKLANKTRCAVIQMSCMRADSGFDILIQRVNDDILSADLQVSVRALNQSVEQLVRANPSHYHWNYKRFKPTKGLEDYYYVDDVAAAQLLLQYRQGADVRHTQK